MDKSVQLYSSNSEDFENDPDTAEIDDNETNLTPIPTGIQNEGCIRSTERQTPNGTRLWTPIVDIEFKPVVGTRYDTWDQVLSSYTLYSQKAGFSIRIGTRRVTNDGLVTYRHILCNKNGLPTGKVFDTSVVPKEKRVRRRSIKVCGCTACVKVKSGEGTEGFEVYELKEEHNHELVDPNNMDLTLGKRKLEFSDKELIVNCKLANIGPSKAHRLQVALKGGHHMVRGTKNDYKNFSRDITEFIGDKDAQYFVNRLQDRSICLNNFTFELLSHGDEIRNLFWVDDVSKLNYQAFGDVLAFDATYHTNKYNMIFVPFTGVDHHKRCVTFGAALLYDETIESFKWVLERFMEAHNNKQPLLVLTDQDPAVKNAVSIVLDKSIHRLCMWHITNKLSLKVSAKLLHETNLRQDMHNRVEDQGNFIYTVAHQDHNMDHINEFKVTLHLSDITVSCSCMSFTRIGYLCRHVFCVFRHHNIKKIPEQYVHKRWRRDALPKTVFDMDNRYAVNHSENSLLRHSIIDNMQKCVDRVRQNVDKLKEIDQYVLHLKNQIFKDHPIDPGYKNKGVLVEEVDCRIF
ncbi:hypothetical protein QVD17_06923 [Tagetes erecta]|uniref:SWIM-type domain-containing protein n=1 Tax=Tagetes erecta TaxID=13708 RepID=A0AAD8LLL1_TARER|nr:hypothetical protein QVD17_06923 [Tagetes erecta]